ncbi:uncharacterized protein STEHIDRAFT_108202 [Stereum hirsutum FP-91666 SS1]|uniref:uncharacterized protein n=1 Tax=Stereum hirsutum (strain FP-91666) TaxID=721885 RepID=UPI0004410458|nr:uncharacterized protein STEHIDRAFT_108202 [Stereum hirsutum FP-91666 SS1]EIM89475.1 hypothetical protein STEHIDRAFT_108202 [Stereum hirsutum FP-91666 SS1]
MRASFSPFIPLSLLLTIFSSLAASTPTAPLLPRASGSASCLWECPSANNNGVTLYSSSDPNGASWVLCEYGTPPNYDTCQYAESGQFAGILWTGSSACPDSAVHVCPTKKRSALDDIVRARSENIVSKRRRLEEKA